MGQIVEKNKIIGEKVIDVSTLSEGVYFLDCINLNGASQKFQLLKNNAH